MSNETVNIIMKILNKTSIFIKLKKPTLAVGSFCLERTNTLTLRKASVSLAWHHYAHQFFIY
jgi:hypothetical protein